jgi:hypothetical protein
MELRLCGSVVWPRHCWIWLTKLRRASLAVGLGEERPGLTGLKLLPKVRETCVFDDRHGGRKGPVMDPHNSIGAALVTDYLYFGLRSYGCPPMDSQSAF